MTSSGIMKAGAVLQAPWSLPVMIGDTIEHQGGSVAQDALMVAWGVRRLLQRIWRALWIGAGKKSGTGNRPSIARGVQLHTRRWAAMVAEGAASVSSCLDDAANEAPPAFQALHLVQRAQEFIPAGCPTRWGGHPAV